MAFIQVFYDGALYDEVPLRSDPSNPVSIGREADCDITIDNAGVSALHAIIWQEGEHFVVADAASKNGVVVNGQTTTRKRLAFGDTIQLPKYVLKLVKTSAGIRFEKRPAPADSARAQKSTVEVDISRLDGLVRERAAKAAAYLSLEKLRAAPVEVALDKVNLRIGKAEGCEVRTSGWLDPKLAATIVRRSDGFYLKPERRGRVRLNGAPVAAQTRLKNGDRFAVRALDFVFHEPASRQPQPPSA